MAIDLVPSSGESNKSKLNCLEAIPAAKYESGLLISSLVGLALEGHLTAIADSRVLRSLQSSVTLGPTKGLRWRRHVEATSTSAAKSRAAPISGASELPA